MSLPVFTLWFEEIRKEDIPKAGGKGANLGEMLNAGIPVPPGFVITAQAYKFFLEKTGIAQRIYQVIKDHVKEVNDPKGYEDASREIRKFIEATPMPKEIKEAIVKQYRELSKRVGLQEAYVAVRSSATAEDLPDASFAGQQETYLNVRGEEELLEKTVQCWSSLFTPRAIFYRQQKGFPHEKVLISVVVQKMVNSKAAGVMFTIHPVTGDPSKIVIEGNWGLGESVVSGSVTPDRFIVDKNTLEVVEQEIAEKTIEYIRDPVTGKTIHAEVPPERRRQPCINQDEIKRLAELAIKIEKHYGRPQDIEWAIDRDLPFPENVFIVQSRAETIWGQRAAAPTAPTAGPTITAAPLLKGLPASPGIAYGVARVAFSPEELATSFNKGDILVTKMTNPDWVPYMRVASAIVTDDGGMTCHAAIVSRELGIPAIVGTGNATKLMKTGQEYTVDAKTGVVYEGKVEAVISAAAPPAPAAAAPTALMAMEMAPITATKIYMNLGVPEKITEYKNLPFDGIGLMRIEFIMASWIGEHPLYLLETGQQQKFIDKLAEGIAMVAREIYPRPVVVRLSDFKTNEYRKLKGGEKYEPSEDNPMLGWRGVSRYVSPQYRDAFRLELKAIKKVRDEMGLKNVWVMLPFVRATWEVEEVLQLMEEEGLRRGRDFKVWAMAEVPSIIFLADEFCKYFDGFSIGSNDLTQLILGTDRDSQILPEIDPRYFDERDPAVRRAIEHLIKTAHRYGVTVSICGQGPSVYPEFTEFLVRCGIDSISVNPDVVTRTRRLVASVERKVMLERLAELQRRGEEEKLELLWSE
ncbi:MAG: phosphoenolpyruvate synthase [Thermoprotei archaeon]|nr:MAG: phosphoenolpyruvate synthase [Thermoprotei archaeon]RLF14526.1 MAG: phosphoenolpyruvate synthase [Thermoprotei archaeon]